MPENPCYPTLFDVFHIDPDETDMRIIRAEIQNARDRLKFGKLHDPKGRELPLNEADLNRLEDLLLDPIARLEAEQFVHRRHRFEDDQELLQTLDALLAEREDPIELLLTILEEALTHSILTFIPPFEPEPLADDLPWPETPDPYPVDLLPLEQAMLMDH